MMDIERLLFDYMEYNMNNAPLSPINYFINVLNYTEEEAFQCIMNIKNYYEN